MARRERNPAARKRGKKLNSQDIDTVIGGLVRALRIERGLSQEQLGNELGVSFQQIQKYEKGANRIAIGRIIQIAAYFKITVHDLIGHGNVAPVAQLINTHSFKLAEEFNDLPPEIVTTARHMLAGFKTALKKK